MQVTNATYQAQGNECNLINFDVADHATCYIRSQLSASCWWSHFKVTSIALNFDDEWVVAATCTADDTDADVTTQRFGEQLRCTRITFVARTTHSLYGLQ
jgi:hypothetical protein